VFSTMIQLFVAVMKWLGDLWIDAVVSKVGATTQEKFRVLSFR
jgi:hypothetical protein